MDYRDWGYDARDSRGPRDPRDRTRDPRDGGRDPRDRTPPDTGGARPGGYEDGGYDGTGYPAGGYGQGGYPPRGADGYPPDEADDYPPRDAAGYPPRDRDGDTGRGGTVYRSGRHSRDEAADPPQSAIPGPPGSAIPGPPGSAIPGPPGSVSGAAPGSRGRARPVWRPTRGARRAPEEEVRSADPGYGAPERGWRTADGGYRTPEGRWRAPYVPYDTGEWRRDERPDTGPAGTGDRTSYSSGTGEIVRYTGPDTGEAAPRQGKTGEVVRYQGGAGAPPRYPDTADGGTRYPGAGQPPDYQEAAGDPPRYPRPPSYSGASDYPGATGETPRYRGGSDVVRYRDREETPRYRDEAEEPTRYPTGTGEVPPYRAGGTGEVARYPGERSRGRGSAEASTPPAPPADIEEPAGYPPADETTVIPRQRPTSSAAYDQPAARRRALGPGRKDSSPGSGRRDGSSRNQADDSPELYTYDPLTLGGGASPAMRYDRASETFDYEPTATGETPIRRPPAAEAAGWDPVGSGSVGAGRYPAGEPAPPVADQRADQPPRGDWRSRTPRPQLPPGRERGTGETPRPPAWQRPTGAQRSPAVDPEEYQTGAGRRPVAGRPVEPPVVQRPPARRYEAPAGRFEGTYPVRTRRPGNLTPLRGRPVPGAEEDDDSDDSPGFLQTALVTVAWYTIPLLLYTMYVLTLNGAAEAGDGESARQDALNGLLGGMPRVGVALITSLVIAMMIRLISRGWRAATIGFASAVVGGGVATVIFTALQR